MNLPKEKEKIKRALSRVDDVRIIFGMKGYIEQYDPNDKMAENYTPQRAKKIDIAKEKQKIIQAVEAAKDKGLLGGLKWFILLYDPEDTYSDLKMAPVASWEMSMPFGRKLTRKQFAEYLDRDLNDGEGVVFSMKQLKKELKRHSDERKKLWDAV